MRLDKRGQEGGGTYTVVLSDVLQVKAQGVTVECDVHREVEHGCAHPRARTQRLKKNARGQSRKWCWVRDRRSVVPMERAEAESGSGRICLGVCGIRLEEREAVD